MGSAAAVGIALAAPASAQQVCDMIPDPDGSVAGTNSVSCGALVNGDFAAGFGVGANVASGGTGLGFDADASEGATAVGSSSGAFGENSVAVGLFATVDFVDYGIAIGTIAFSGGEGSVAIGGDADGSAKGAEALGTLSIAIGADTNATGQGSIAIGGDINFNDGERDA